MAQPDDITIRFSWEPTFDTPSWTAEEIARRLGTFLGVEMETVVTAHVQSAGIARRDADGELVAIEITPSPAVMRALGQALGRRS